MKQNIQKIRQSLAQHYPKEEIDAFVRIIFEKLMGYSQVDMILRSNEALPDFISEKIDRIIDRLIMREPIQYILDDAYFYGMHFHVNRNTLIPRPETEQLIDLIVNQNSGVDLQVLDIGTGSGCIAIALARTLKFPIVTATDISAEAIAVAERNAKELKVKIRFTNSDILATSRPKTPIYDIIVSNPPYITDRERSAMDANVTEYEPHTALFVPDNNPLLFYRAIADYAIGALKSGGHLYFEINPLFANDVVDMLAYMGYTEIATERDYTGKLRFTTAKR